MPIRRDDIDYSLKYKLKKKQKVMKRGKSLHTRIYDVNTTDMKRSQRKHEYINELVMKKIKKLQKKKDLKGENEIQLTYMTDDNIFISSKFFKVKDKVFKFPIQKGINYGGSFQHDIIEDTPIKAVIINYF